MFNRSDIRKNEYMLVRGLAKQGYDWWWHSFTGRSETTGKERAFFVEFFICNPALSEDKPVLGQLPENRRLGKRPSYLMVKAGAWGEDRCQLHRFFSLKEAEIHGRAPFSVSAADCYCSDGILKGSVEVSSEDASAHPEFMCGSGSMRWDLRLEKKTAFNVGYGTSRLFRFLEAFEMYWHAEGMKTLYSGTVIYNGEKYTVDPETSFGYADKNWGRGFTSPWVWLSSCDLTSNLTGRALTDSVFDIGGGRPKIWFLSLDRKLLSAFWYEGKPYEFNFSKFWTRTGTEFDFKETEDAVFWHVRQETRTAVMETEVSCRKEDMILVNYEAPDGTKRHNRLWNGGNGTGNVKLWEKRDGGLVLIDDISFAHCGCEYGEYGPPESSSRLP